MLNSLWRADALSVQIVLPDIVDDRIGQQILDGEASADEEPSKRLEDQDMEEPPDAT